MANSKRSGTRLPSLPQVPHSAKFPRGPKWLYQPEKDKLPVNTWLSPPPGFITPTNSLVEWMIYKALWKVLHIPGDPEDGPFIGFPGIFHYQQPFEGGRQRLGGSVIDFYIEANRFTGYSIAFRIQTEYFHGASGRKVGLDRLQEARIARGYVVRDIYEYAFIRDVTGEAACREVIRALSGGQAPDPASGFLNTVIRDRPAVR